MTKRTVLGGAVLIAGLIVVAVVATVPHAPVASVMNPKVEAKFSLSHGNQMVYSAIPSNPCDLHMAVSTPPLIGCVIEDNFSF